MKAITQDRYGSVEVLEAREIDVPEIAEGEVLVRVHAASIHVGDWILMTGTPRIMRLGTGLRKPKNPVPGTDIAGIVEAIGPNVHEPPPRRRGVRLVLRRLRGVRKRTGGSARSRSRRT